MEYIKHLPIALFSVLFGKLLISGSSWTDVGILLILASYSAFYQLHIQSTATKLLHTRLDEFDKHLSTLYKGQEDLKTRVNTVHAASSLRPANFR